MAKTRLGLGGVPRQTYGAFAPKSSGDAVYAAHYYRLLMHDEGLGMEKNVAGKWVVFAFNETNNTAVTGDAANITANIRIDGGAANAVDDLNPTELEDGYYVFDITAVESNGDLLSLHPASSTSNVQVIGIPGAVWTRPANFNVMGIESDGDLTKVNTLDGHTAQTGDSFARLGAPAGASVSADIATVDGNVDSVLADTNELQTDWANGGRLDVILDARASQTSVDTVDTNVDAILVDTGTTLPATLGTPAGASISADIATVDTNVDAILVDTDTTIPALIAALNDLSEAQVNAQVLDVMNTDTFGEPTGVPAATATIVTKLGYLYMALRNQLDLSATKKTFYGDDGVAEWEKDLTDDGTTYSESEANAI